MKCEGCGCTDEFACEGGCSWTYPRICSSCWEIHERVVKALEQNKAKAQSAIRARRVRDA
jgi:hypothetical protein